MSNVQIPEAFAELFEPARYKGFHGGRGSGKSHSFARALLIKAAQKPLRVLCGREVQRSIKDSVKQLLDDQIQAMGLGEYFHSLQNEIRTPGGGLFSFVGLGSMSIDQIKSMEGYDIFWGEEAQTFSARSIETLVPTIRKDDSELWFSWNRRNVNDPIEQILCGPVIPERAIVRHVNWSDNPFFPDVLNEERLFDQKNKPDRYAHIWEGAYEPAAVGAIWDRVCIARNRTAEHPTLNRILVSVDPAVTDTENSDEHGIIVVGLGEDQRGYVLEDRSRSGTPREWALDAIASYDYWEADAIVIEVNQGGDMVRHVIESVRPGIRIIEVRAAKGKVARAEPISALYAMDRISHVGTFTELESQMCQMGSGRYLGDGSPDRVDALVWGFSELFDRMTRAAPEPTFVRTPVQGSWMG